MIQYQYTTLERYEKMTPYERGFTHYMEAEWNRNIAKRVPFKKGTKEYAEFCEGSKSAMFNCQDMEE